MEEKGQGKKTTGDKKIDEEDRDDLTYKEWNNLKERDKKNILEKMKSKSEEDRDYNRPTRNGRTGRKEE